MDENNKEDRREAYKNARQKLVAKQQELFLLRKKIEHLQQKNNQIIISQHDALNDFYKRYNQWLNKGININFKEFYVFNFKDKLEEAQNRAELYMMQTNEAKEKVLMLIKNASLRETVQLLFEQTSGLHELTRNVLLELKSELSKIYKVKGEKEKIVIAEIQHRVYQLSNQYNIQYMEKKNELMPLNIRFMKAVEDFVFHLRASKEN